jgi:hypothetical protein
MLVGDLLQLLDLGNSVAEHDALLERYFVETATFEAIIGDKADVVAGDKGTGKTALFKILEKRYASVPELNKVEVLPAFNPTGSPVFQRLAEGEPMQEALEVLDGAPVSRIELIPPFTSASTGWVSSTSASSSVRRSTSSRECIEPR